MLHVAIIHKQLDICMETSQEVEKSFKNWIELENCVVCNELMSAMAESSKRLHYLEHFQSELELRINSETQKILKKPPPYNCAEPSCSYTTELSPKAFLGETLVLMGVCCLRNQSECNQASPSGLQSRCLVALHLNTFRPAQNVCRW